jgi:hypothetical protein
LTVRSFGDEGGYKNKKINRIGSGKFIYPIKIKEDREG